MTARMKAVASAVMAASMVVTAACSSSKTSTGESGSTKAQSAAVAAAKAETTQYVATQPAIQIEPISGTIPRNVSLGVLNCTFPVCVASTDPALAAAQQKLSWTVNQVRIPTTPEQYVSGWNKILQLNPDAVLYAGAFPATLVASQLAKIAEKKIPTVVLSPNAATSAAAGSNYAVAGSAALAQSGRLMGDVIVSDADGGTKVAFITDPTLGATLKPVRAALSRVVSGAGGSVADLEISLTGVGKDVPGQVVNYVRSHPDVKYLAFSLSDFATGVPQALQAAGVADKVKIVSRAPQATNLANIKDGTEFASVGEEVSANGYRAVDDLIRLKMGLTPPDPNPVGWHQIFVKSNVTQTSQVPATPGVPEAFYSAWHVSS